MRGQLFELHTRFTVLANLASVGNPQASTKLAANRSGDEIERFDLGIGVEVGDRGAFQYLTRLRICGLQRKIKHASGGGQRREGTPVRIGGEQLLHEPRCDVIPSLQQQRNRNELAVLRRANMAHWSHTHHRLESGLLCEAHKVVCRQSGMARHLTGIEFANIHVGVFIHHFPGPTRGLEASQITDFKGFVGSAHITGTGTGTLEGVQKRLTYDLDNRFMQGTYVGVDGQRHFGTFGFI